MEAHPGAMEDHVGAMEAHPGAMEADPGALETHPGGLCNKKLPPAHMCHSDKVRMCQEDCFASSPRRPDREYKRMVLEHTHGLFIT
jgi:hypothetical protein